MSKDKENKANTKKSKPKNIEKNKGKIDERLDDINKLNNVPARINTDNHTKYDKYTLKDILESNAVKTVAKALASFMDQSKINDIAKNKIRNKELDNEVKLRKLDIEAESQEYKHIRGFDIRNKTFSIVMLIIVIIATVLLKYFEILGRDEAKTIIIIALTISMTSNIDFIKKLFTKKKDD